MVESDAVVRDQPQPGPRGPPAEDRGGVHSIADGRDEYVALSGRLGKLGALKP